MTQAAAALDVSAQAKRTVRLVTQSPALRQALQRAFVLEEASLSLRIDGEGGAPAGPVDVLVLDLGSETSQRVGIAPVVVRLVPRSKWFSLTPAERQPGRVFPRPDDSDDVAIGELAGSVVAALRPYRARRAAPSAATAARATRSERPSPSAASAPAVTPRSTGQPAPAREALGASARSPAAPADRARAPGAERPAAASPTPTPTPTSTPTAAKQTSAGGATARHTRPQPQPERARDSGSTTGPKPAPLAGRPAGSGATEVRRTGRFQPRILVVGSSTGGPQALMTMFRALPHPLNMPVLVVQHMPPTFTPMLAEHINSATSWPCREAQDNEAVTSNEARIAPGGFHLELAESPNGTRLKLHQGPPVNFCRPAVDVLFHSAARIYGRHTLAVILTGMGSDGALGAEAIRTAGGMVFVQDEETSVVWGMPGAAARIGAADKILPLDHIAKAVASVTKGVL